MSVCSYSAAHGYVTDSAKHKGGLSPCKQKDRDLRKARRNKKVCRNYATTGSCKFGEHCWFLHVSEPSLPITGKVDNVWLCARPDPLSPPGPVPEIRSYRGKVCPLAVRYVYMSATHCGPYPAIGDSSARPSEVGPSMFAFVCACSSPVSTGTSRGVNFMPFWCFSHSSSAAHGHVLVLRKGKVFYFRADPSELFLVVNAYYRIIWCLSATEI